MAVRKKWTEKQSLLSTYQVVDNLYAALWAGITIDLETVVSDFLRMPTCDYKSFISVAETRKLIAVHRSSFSVLQQETGTIVTDKWSRGKFVDQLSSYTAIQNIILNAAKDVWLETLAPLPNRNLVVEFKRNLCGLYLLYYLWHNQIPADQDKVLIKFSEEDRKLMKTFVERLQKIKDLLPESETTERCCKFVLQSLEKRNAFQYCYISDEPKLDFHYWEYLNLKKSMPRLMLTSINANNQNHDLLQEMHDGGNRFVRILQEVKALVEDLSSRSLLLRKVLPAEVVKQLMTYDPTTFEPASIMMPTDYSSMAITLGESMNQFAEETKHPFLKLDGLLRSTKAAEKLRLVGVNAASGLLKKHVYSKRSYEKGKITFNEACEKFNVSDYKLPATSKWRPLQSSAWLFVAKKFEEVFRPDRNSKELPKIYETVAIPPKDVLASCEATESNSEQEDNGPFENKMEDALTRRKRCRGKLLGSTPDDEKAKRLKRDMEMPSTSQEVIMRRKSSRLKPMGTQA